MTSGLSGEVDSADEIRHGLRRVQARQQRQALLLALPLILYLSALFIFPIGVFLLRSIDNSEIHRALPQVRAALQTHRGAEIPNDALAAALAADLAASRDNGTLIPLARRLNQHIAGYRTVIVSTANQIDDRTRPTTLKELAAINKAWADPAYWVPIRLYQGRMTLDYLLRALDLEYDPAGSVRSRDPAHAIYLQLFARTAWISLVVTVLCGVIGFPIAYQLAQASGITRAVLLFCVLLPFWTSLLVRTAAWMIILQGYGPVNSALLTLGVINEPAQLIGNRFGVYVAMVQVLLPFMVLPLYGVMKAIPKEHMRAAKSLGAAPLTAFVRVYLPACVPGLSAGATLVFITALGYYVTPRLVGGPRDQMISSFIAFYVLEASDWGLAAALGVILLAATLVCFLALRRFAPATNLTVR